MSEMDETLEAVIVELETLLEEWLAWWRFADEAPAKMPNALHVRTAISLQLLRLSREEGERMVAVEMETEEYGTCDMVCALGAHSLACVKARTLPRAKRTNEH